MPTPTGTVEGLEDVVAGTTAICTVDGINGRLIYRGYDIRDLAEHATFEDFLYMLNGERPSDVFERTMDIALILHADHEFNASTFAGRVTAATLSDMHSAITSAIGALKGPLHGGANEGVITMLKEIGSPERA